MTAQLPFALAHASSTRIPAASLACGPPNRRGFGPEQGASIGSPCHISSLLVRAACLIRFPVWTRHGEDALFLLDLVREGPIEIVAEPLVVYRRHAQSQSMRDPDIATKWHGSFDRWIVEYSDIADANDRSRLRAAAVRPLINALATAYWRRDWERFDRLYLYLASRRDVPGVGPAVHNRRYPRWFYTIKDYVDRLTRKSRERRPLAQEIPS